MSKVQKTKKGVAAIYVVVFTTMLIGIITLSFLRIMLSESGRTLNDTLSDSAYNAALAGVEDAKYVVSKYETAVAAKQTKDTNGMMKVLEESDGTECDIIRSALNYTSTIEHSEESIGTDQSFQDQAYTCVTINLRGNFKGTLSLNNPTLVVPLRPSGQGEETVNNVEYVKLTWHTGDKDDSSSTSSFSGTELRHLGGSGLNGDVNNINALKDNAKVLGQKGVESTDYPTELNGLRMMLVQSPASGNVDYYASEGGKTNRGTLMLLASDDGVEEIEAGALVNSADKTLNAPQIVKCEKNGSCSVKVGLPKPKSGTGDTDRNPDNFFLVLNQLYSEPTIRVTVEMYDKNDKEIPFFNVQPIVDSTGRSGDLFRRVEARIGTDNGASLIPTAELSSNSDIDKSFYVTKNCIKGTGTCNE